MIMGTHKRQRHTRAAALRPVVERRLQRIAELGDLQLPAHAVDAQLVERMRRISSEAAPVETGELR